MKIRRATKILLIFFCSFSTNALPWESDDIGPLVADEMWSPGDFDSAAKSGQQDLEPVETGLDELGQPRMMVRTNFKDAHGSFVNSQLFPPANISVEDREKLALNFFSKFNYYASNEMVVKEDLIKKMQRNYGLTETGELNDETVALMLAPRCGNPDRAHDYTYFPGSPKWWKSELTYKIVGYSPDISPCQTRNTIRKALHMWAEQIELTFTEKGSSEPADIEIYFAYGKHKDPYRFDARYGVLAHAFPPGRYNLAGDTHFDESEYWTLGKGTVADTYYGNSKGRACVFPFIFKGRTYKSCTTDGRKDGFEWCSTTANFDKDKKYGFCPGPQLFTYGGNAKGRRCKFPFTYRGQTFNKCTDAGRDDRYKWCSTTKNFDVDKKWGLCPGKVDPSQGKGRSLLIVAAHEFGHAIGLEHSRSRSALMYPTYKYTEDFKLSYDDIRGARSLYGSRKSPLPPLKQERCGRKISVN